MQKQSGFGALEIVSAIAIVGLLAVVGWFAYSTITKNNSQADRAQSAPTKDITQNAKKVAKKTYTSSQLGLSFDYPADWVVKTNPTNGNAGTGDNSAGDNMVVVSPTGYTLFFDELAPSGLGGICPAIETTDFTLFGKTNLSLESYVVGYSHNDIYKLIVSTKPDQAAANNDSCTYNSVLQLAEFTDENTPTIALFGSYALGQEQVSTTKPSGSELQQAADILLSLRK